MKIVVIKLALFFLVVPQLAFAGDELNKFIKYSVIGKQESHESEMCEMKCERTYPIRSPIQGLLGPLFFRPTKEQQEKWEQNKEKHWQCKKKCSDQEKCVDQEIMTFDDTNGKGLQGSGTYKNCTNTCWQERNGFARSTLGAIFVSLNPLAIIDEVPLGDQALRQCVAKCIKIEHPEIEKNDQN